MLSCACGLLSQCFAVQLSGWAQRVSDIGRGSTESYDLDVRVRGHGWVMAAEIGDVPFESSRLGEVEIFGLKFVESFHHHRGDFHGKGAMFRVLEVRQSSTRAVAFVPPHSQRLRPVFDRVEVAGVEPQRVGAESGCR